jgi:hypothetical protein
MEPQGSVASGTCGTRLHASLGGVLMNDPTKAGFLDGLGQLADKQAEVLDHGVVFRLLPGEEPSRPAPEDADYRCAVFDELIRFTEDLLERVGSEPGEAPAPPVVEQGRVILELQRLRAHRDHWSRRGGDPSRRAS